MCMCFQTKLLLFLNLDLHRCNVIYTMCKLLMSAFCFIKLLIIFYVKWCSGYKTFVPTEDFL